MGSGLLCQCPLCSADGLDFFHPLFDGGFREIRPLLELFQDAGAFVFLLEALDGAVNGFIVRDDDADQTKSPPSACLQFVSGSTTTFSRSFRSPSLSNATTIALSPPEVRSLETTFPIPHSVWKI